jgi:uncharacterized protein (TIGR00297 family)
VRRWLLAACLGSAIAAIAYSRRTLTLDGAVAAAGVGAIVFAKGGARGAAALLAFFVSSSALSRLGQRRKQQSTLAQAKGAQRDAWQVLANGGFAALSIAAGKPRAFVGALATAGADTWATELGMLARTRPRLLTTMRPVAPGTSGGVTLEGSLASAGGALVVGLVSGQVRRALIAGIAGSLLDSLLGATLQAAYWCDACQVPAEEPLHVVCTSRTRRIKGSTAVNNDTVNAAATLAGALIGAIS